MTPPARHLLLCADDFGQSPGISQGIARLAAAGRLGATTCLTNAAAWPAQAPRLRDLPAAVQTGLHFNLSEGRPLSAELRRLWPELPPLPRLLLAAHLRRLPRAALAAELQAQWQAFIDATGRAPDFIDGHQHVHHLPQVREVLLQWLTRQPRTPVRSTGHLPGSGFAIKRALIEHTGGRALQRALARAGIPHNTALLGAYDFAGSDYRSLFRGWLADAPADGALLFCHPGEADPAPDAIAAARIREADYLGSGALLDDAAAAGVLLNRRPLGAA